MLTALSGLVVVLAVLTVGLGVALWRQRAALRRLKAQAGDLEAHLHLDTMRLSQVYKRGKDRFVTIEILNPLEVAAAESQAARTVGGLTPAFITKIVYDRVKSEVEANLVERGIEARVEIRRA